MPRDHLYLANQATIERILLFTARRHRCGPDEAEDFAAWARLKLVEDDYAILADFQGRASVGSYLAVVVQRLLLDYRNAKWGKWRPSAEAKRLGPLAVRLETLLSRDGLSLEEAYQLLRTADPRVSREVVEDLRERLPVRVSRRFEGEETLESLAAPAPAAEDLVLRKEQETRQQRASAALADVMRSLDDQDQIILRLRFVEGMQIADIARLLRQEARPFYRRIERLVAGLRQRLGERGIGGEDFGFPLAAGGKRSSQDRLIGG